MSYFLHLLFGFVIAFAVMISPGMLNMTALKVSSENGVSNGVKFAIGAALVIFVQVGIALFFADYFVNHPKIVEVIEEVGVVIFIILSFYFFKISRKKSVRKKTKNIKTNFFLAGFGMASLDVLTIPFYITVTAFLASRNSIELVSPYTFLFMIGVMMGAFLLLFTYVKFAKIISEKVSFLTKNINIILSLIFLILAVITIIKLLNE